MSDNLSEKQLIEQATARIFLEIYNERESTDFAIVELGDTPDVTCKDEDTGKELYLEITLLEDWPGDIQALLGRGTRRESSPVTGYPAISFEQDTLRVLRERLEDKLLSQYDSRTALVIRQVGILWSAEDYKRHTHHMAAQVFKGRENHYGAGVWIICTNTKTWPSTYDIYSLSELARMEEPQKPNAEEEDNPRARVTYERLVTEDFNAFAARPDVDPIVRVDSPHECAEAVLIAFKKDEPEVFRQQTIDFYRDQMVYYCICGKGEFSSST